MSDLIPHDEAAINKQSRAHEQKVSFLLNSLLRTLRLVRASSTNFDLGYTPGVPTDWNPVPDTVWDALDELASGYLRLRNQPPGRDGEDGADGLTIPGRDGRDGVAGTSILGRDGDDGVDGLTIPGRDGSDGVSAPVIPARDGDDGADAFQFPPPINGIDGLAGIPVPGRDGDDADSYVIPGPKGDRGDPGLFVPGRDGDDGDSFVFASTPNQADIDANLAHVKKLVFARM